MTRARTVLESFVWNLCCPGVKSFCDRNVEIVRQRDNQN